MDLQAKDEVTNSVSNQASRLLLEGNESPHASDEIDLAALVKSSTPGPSAGSGAAALLQRPTQLAPSGSRVPPLGSSLASPGSASPVPPGPAISQHASGAASSSSSVPGTVPAGSTLLQSSSSTEIFASGVPIRCLDGLVWSSMSISQPDRVMTLFRCQPLHAPLGPSPGFFYFAGVGRSDNESPPVALVVEVVSAKPAVAKVCWFWLAMAAVADVSAHS